MDDKLKKQHNPGELLFVTSPLEEQETLRMRVLSVREQQGKLIQPKFTLKQKTYRKIGARQTPGLQKRILIPLEIEKETDLLEAMNSKKIIIDNNDLDALQIHTQTWNPGTFGFAEDESEERTSASHLPLLSSSNAMEVVNNVYAPNTQKTGRAVIIKLLSWAIPIPVVFLVTALLTRYLGPTAYGKYSFTFTFFTAFALLSGTGMDQLFIRKLARQTRTEWGNTLGYAVGIRLLSTTASAILAVLLVLILPMDPTLRNLLLLGSVWLFFSFSVNTVGTAYSSGFVAEQRIGKLSVLTMTNRMVTSGLVVLVVSLRLSLLWAYALIIYSDLPFFIILIIIARRRFGVRIRFSLAHTRKYLFSSLPLTGHDALALMSGQADILLLVILTNPVNVGLYALATKLTDPLLSIVFAYLGGLYPLLCVQFEEGRVHFTKIYRESVRIIALVIIPLAIFICVEANSIITLLGGQSFAPAAVALRLLMLSTAVTFLQQLTVRACTAANLERRMPYMSAISVSINLLANLALIPHWQFVGAAIASLLSSVISLVLFSLLVRHQLHLLPAINILLRVFLGNLPMLLFMIWQQRSTFLVTVPVALLLTLVGCLTTRAISLKDIHSLQLILHKRSNEEALDKKEKSEDINKQPVANLPSFKDIADYPTFIIPSIRV